MSAGLLDQGCGIAYIDMDFLFGPVFFQLLTHDDDAQGCCCDMYSISKHHPHLLQPLLLARATAAPCSHSHNRSPAAAFMSNNSFKCFQ